MLEEETLLSRQTHVTDIARRYYQGDVVPPSTKSQILRAQKFSVYYYYAMNFLFFVYSFFIPLHSSDPFYGGLDPRQAKFSEASAIIFGILVSIPMLRFTVMTWSIEFYHFACVLGMLEIVILVFVMINWSTGLPVLGTLFVANMLNIAVSQLYWKHNFATIVKNLEELVPPAASQGRDTTNVSIFGNLYVEWRKLWGFQKFKTAAALHDERCGVFSAKEQLGHSKAMFLAYMQALEGPRARWAQWKHVAEELWNLNILALLDGLVNTFISNVFYAFAGIWLGKVLFVNWYHGVLAIVFALGCITSFSVSLWRTVSWLTDALGVAVAEKEWLAHDVVRHTGEREEMILDTLDLSYSPKAKSPMASAQVGSPKGAQELQVLQGGRLNLVFMWLCVATVASFIGESYLAKLYLNLSVQSRYMVEALTPYDFKLFPHAKYEVIHLGTSLKMFQSFALVTMSALFFGSYFYESMPVPLMACICVSTFIQSVLKLMEALEFAFTILGKQGKSTERHKWVSEWIVVISLLFVLTNVGIWLYLLPMMKGWDLPVGKCRADYNQVMFPAACGGI